MADCLIGLGSNVGNRVTLLDQAIDQICGCPQNTLRGVSRYHEMPPIGGPAGQGPFLNAAIRITTELSPEQLLAQLRVVERDLGRKRLERWGPRSIDIDVLLYDLLIMATVQLELPHPRMAVRRFVLEPACEVGADMLHAPTGWTLQQLLARLDEPPCYVAVCCADQRPSTALVAAATERLGARRLSVDLESAGPTTAETPPAALRQALELVTRQSDLLESVKANRVQQGLLLSDFWLNQSLALARTWPFGSAREQLEQACRVAIARAPQPRFILHLDVAPSLTQAQPDRPPESHTPPQPASTSLASELLRQVAVAGQGPVLRVAAGDLDLALVELRAGVDAMR